MWTRETSWRSWEAWVAEAWLPLQKQILHPHMNPRCPNVFHNQSEAWPKVEQCDILYEPWTVLWQQWNNVTRIAFFIPVRWWMILSSFHLLTLMLSPRFQNFLRLKCHICRPQTETTVWLIDWWINGLIDWYSSFSYNYFFISLICQLLEKLGFMSQGS